MPRSVISHAILKEIFQTVMATDASMASKNRWGKFIREIDDKLAAERKAVEEAKEAINASRINGEAGTSGSTPSGGFGEVHPGEAGAGDESGAGDPAAGAGASTGGPGGGRPPQPHQSQPQPRRSK